jgi:hypothetical protein
MQPRLPGRTELLRPLQALANTLIWCQDWRPLKEVRAPPQDGRLFPEWRRGTSCKWVFSQARCWGPASSSTTIHQTSSEAQNKLTARLPVPPQLKITRNGYTRMEQSNPATLIPPGDDNTEVPTRCQVVLSIKPCISPRGWCHFCCVQKKRCMHREAN